MFFVFYNILLFSFAVGNIRSDRIILQLQQLLQQPVNYLQNLPDHETELEYHQKHFNIYKNMNVW